MQANIDRYLLDIEDATKHTLENHITYAVRHNDPKMLQIILENTPGLDQDELAQGLLLTARKGYVECAEVLLAVGAPPDVHDMSGFTAIILAAKAGHLSVIQLLTNGKYSCNVNKANYRVRATAIHWAATNGHLACVQELISAKAEITRRTYQGRTALMLAARSGHVDVVEELLSAGSDVTATDIEGASVVHMAAEEGCVYILGLLNESGADFNAQKKSGDTPLVLAARNGQYDAVALLLTLDVAVFVDGQNMNALHFAAESGHTGCVQLLLDAGVPVDVQTTDMCYTARSLINGGVTPLMLAARQGQVETMVLLIDNGATVDCMDDDGQTALLLASKYNHPPCVSVLLSRGADVDGVELQDNPVFGLERGVSPLFVAIKENNIDVIKVLLHANCNLRVLALESNDNLVTSLEYAFNKHRIVAAQLLLTVDTSVPVINDSCIANFLSRLHVQDEDLEQWFSNELEQVKRLQHLCRCRVRHSVQKPVQDKVTELPLPKTMINYLMFNEFNEQF